MKTSEAGLALIREFEGFAPKPYRCPAGYWTVGYGHLITKDEAIKFNAGIPIAMAEILLKNDIKKAEEGVMRLVKCYITQNQFDALVSFVFNLGVGRFKASTLLRKLNNGDTEAAANEFTKWVFGGGKKLPGLVRRREAEKQLFLATPRRKWFKRF